MTKRGPTRAVLARGSYFNPLDLDLGLAAIARFVAVSRPYGSIAARLAVHRGHAGNLGLVVWYRSSGAHLARLDVSPASERLAATKVTALSPWSA